MLDRVRTEEVRTVDIRGQHHEAARSETSDMPLHQFVQAASSVHEHHRRVAAVAGRACHQRRHVHALAVVADPLGVHAVVVGNRDPAFIPEVAVPPPAARPHLLIGMGTCKKRQPTEQQESLYQELHEFNSFLILFTV
jgi:hypothetical protein